MKTISVKDLMVPLEEYATVPLNATLFEAVLALEKAHKGFDPAKHKHRSILVLDESDRIVGKLVMLDILMALEPKYGELEAQGTLSRSGYSPDMIQSMFKDHFLWTEPLQFICSRAPNLKVQDFMELPTEAAYINAAATLDEAVHQLIVCRYQSLLVTRKDQVAGILRLSDVFTKICEMIKTCEM